MNQMDKIKRRLKLKVLKLRIRVSQFKARLFTFIRFFLISQPTAIFFCYILCPKGIHSLYVSMRKFRNSLWTTEQISCKYCKFEIKLREHIREG